MITALLIAGFLVSYFTFALAVGSYIKRKDRLYEPKREPIPAEANEKLSMYYEVAIDE